MGEEETTYFYILVEVASPPPPPPPPLTQYVADDAGDEHEAVDEGERDEDLVGQAARGPHPALEEEGHVELLGAVEAFILARGQAKAGRKAQFNTRGTIFASLL